MPNVSRPDLLPFALPDTIGLPFHGLVRNGKLTLPDATEKTYHQPRGCETHLMRGRQYAAPVRNAYQQSLDAQKNYSWKNYALLSGTTRDIGGQELGADRFLYSDANASWVIRIIASKGFGSCSVEVWLTGLFGCFRSPSRSVAFTARKLAELEWTPTAYDGSAMTPSNREVLSRHETTHSQHGEITLINCFSDGTYATHDQLGWYYTQGQHDVIRVDVSGNGSLLAGSLGAGISATVTQYKTAQDLEIVPFFDTRTDDDDTNSFTTVGGGEWQWRFAVRPDKSIGNFRRVRSFYAEALWNPSLQWSTSAATDEYSFFDSVFSSTHTQYTDWNTYTQTDVVNDETFVSDYPDFWDLVGYTDSGGLTHLPAVPLQAPVLILMMASYKTGVAVSHYGHSRPMVGAEIYGDNWTVEPVDGTIVSSATDEVCFV